MCFRCCDRNDVGVHECAGCLWCGRIRRVQVQGAGSAQSAVFAAPSAPHHPVSFSRPSGQGCNWLPGQQQDQTGLLLSHLVLPQSLVSASIIFWATRVELALSLQMHLGVGEWMPQSSWKPISEELIKDALEIILDVNSHPILVMCSWVFLHLEFCGFFSVIMFMANPRGSVWCQASVLIIHLLIERSARAGIHMTGTVVGCLRRLQQWNLTPILEEVSFSTTLHILHFCNLRSEINGWVSSCYLQSC